MSDKTHTELLGEWIKVADELSAKNRTLEGRVIQLTEKLESLEEDAKRYRFLRDQHSCAWEEELDAEIEAAS
jgi:hypothetical protein